MLILLTLSMWAEVCRQKQIFHVEGLRVYLLIKALATAVWAYATLGSGLPGNARHARGEE